MNRIISLALVALIGIGMMSLDQNGKGKGKGNGGEAHGSQKNKNTPQNKDISITIKNPKQPPQLPNDGVSHKGNGKHNKDKDHASKNGKANNGNHKDHHPAHSNGNHYGKHKDGMTGREFGQHRAAQARAKHKPKNEKEAIHIIEVVHIENVSLLGLIKDKMDRVRDRIEDRFRTGFLTRNAYEIHKKRIGILENRRKELHRLLIP